MPRPRSLNYVLEAKDVLKDSTSVTMARAKIAVVCGLKVRVVCQDRLCMNSDADETLA